MRTVIFSKIVWCFRREGEDKLMNTTYLEHKLFYSYEQSNKQITFNFVHFSVIELGTIAGL